MNDPYQELDSAKSELNRVLIELQKTRTALLTIAKLPGQWCANWRTCPHRNCEFPRRVALIAIGALPDAGDWRVS